MDLTTLARVKVFLEATNADDDTWLTQAVTDVSLEFEAYLSRHVEQISRVVTLYPEPGEDRFLVRGTPIASVTSITYDGVTIASDDYAIMSDVGVIILKYDLSLVRGGALVITYVGGMATNTTTFIAAYPNIAGAADLQVAKVYRRRKQLDAETIRDEGGNVTISSATMLDPRVRRILDAHRFHNG